MMRHDPVVNILNPLLVSLPNERREVALAITANDPRPAASMDWRIVLSHAENLSDIRSDFMSDSMIRKYLFMWKSEPLRQTAAKLAGLDAEALTNIRMRAIAGLPKELVLRLNRKEGVNLEKANQITGLEVIILSDNHSPSKDSGALYIISSINGINSRDLLYRS
jgi:hypothetical protein